MTGWDRCMGGEDRSTSNRLECVTVGHSFFNLGPTDMPIATSEVLMTLSSQFQPNKVANVAPMRIQPSVVIAAAASSLLSRRSD